MAGFLFALVIAFLSGIGARDRALFEHLCRAGAPRGALLTTAIATASIAAALAARLGEAAAPEFAAHTRPMLAGAALVIAGTRLLPAVWAREPQEPTRSLGAAALVLFAYQISDTARFAVLAIALSGSALPAAVGGALGSAAALAGRWRWLTQPGRGRQALGVLLMVAGMGWIYRFW